MFREIYSGVFSKMRRLRAAYHSRQACREHISPATQGKMIYHLVDPQTQKETHDGRMIAVKEIPLHSFSIDTSQSASKF